MEQTSAILNFPKQMVDRPVISKVIREFDVEVNILQASITPKEDGRMFAIFSGPENAVEGALAFIRKSGVTVFLPKKNLAWNDDMCVSCSACVGQCPSNALSMDPKTHLVSYDGERCIACELCIPACSYNAIESIDNYLRNTGELG